MLKLKDSESKIKLVKSGYLKKDYKLSVCLDLNKCIGENK